MKQPKTNTQVVKDYMDGSAVNQLFLMEAIGRYAKQCAERKGELIEAMKHTMINGEAWVKAAEDWNKTYKENYEN